MLNNQTFSEIENKSPDTPYRPAKDYFWLKALKFRYFCVINDKWMTYDQYQCCCLIKKQRHNESKPIFADIKIVILCMSDLVQMISKHYEAVSIFKINDFLP